MSEEREMTLKEWVERLPECHRARKEYAATISLLRKIEREWRHNCQYITTGHQVAELASLMQEAEVMLRKEAGDERNS